MPGAALDEVVLDRARAELQLVTARSDLIQTSSEGVDETSFLLHGSLSKDGWGLRVGQLRSVESAQTAVTNRNSMGDVPLRLLRTCADTRANQGHSAWCVLWPVDSGSFAFNGHFLRPLGARKVPWTASVD